MSYSNKQVAAQFAQNALTMVMTDMRSGHGSPFIDGKTVWSYGKHWPVATIVGRGKVILNIDKTSTTTSKHMGMVRGALAQAGVEITTYSHRDQNKVPVAPDAQRQIDLER